MSAIGNPRPSPLTAPPQPQAPVPAPEQRPGQPWKWLILLLILGFGGWAAWQFGFRQPPAERAAAPVAIRTTKVATGSLVNSLRVGGTTSARQFVSIAAPLLRGPESGRDMVLLTMVPSGTRVKEGQVVAQIDGKSAEDHIDDVKDMVAQAASDIRKRQAEHSVDMENLTQTLRVAKADLDKARLEAQAAEVRTAIDQELLKLAADEAEARYKQALSDIEFKKAAQAAEIRILAITKIRQDRHLERHVFDIKRYTIRSTMDGLAVAQQMFRGGEFDTIKQGDQVSPGQVFMKIVKPELMQVEGSVNQAESSLIRIGQRATVRLDAFPGLNFPGRIYSIGALATGGWRQQYYIRNVPVRIAIESSDSRLIPDLSASADVELERADNVAYLPLGSVFDDGGREVVFVKKGSTFEKRGVSLGLRNATHAVVVAGVTAGEEVALERPRGM